MNTPDNLFSKHLGKQFNNWLAKTVCEYWRSGAGNVATIFGLLLIPIILAVGGGIDFANASRVKANLQEVIDAAVLAGAISLFDPNEAESKAAIYYDSHEKPIQAIANFSIVDDKILGSASGLMPTSFLGIIGIDTLDINVEASATDVATLQPACFMAMHPTRKHTLELKDSVSVIAPDCNIYGNSDHPWDVVDPHKIENFLIGRTVQAIGYGHHYLENVIPPLEYAPYLIPDPLAGMTIPTAGSCDFNNLKFENETITLNPGTYCGGLEIKNGSVVTLNPGTYIIADNKFKIFNSVLTGEEVTIVLADDKVKIDWKNSEIRLSAPIEGEYASMVMMGVREDTDHKFDRSIVDLHGIVYLPNGAFVWKNTGSPAITALWTVWIVDGVSWKGDGDIYINFKPEDSDIPYPDELNVIPRPEAPRLLT